MHVPRLFVWTATSVGGIVLLLWLLPRLLNPTPPTPEERRRDAKWVSSSPYWLDRQACRWLGLCGVHHLRWDGPTRKDLGADEAGASGMRSADAPSGTEGTRQRQGEDTIDGESIWNRLELRSVDWETDGSARQGIEGRNARRGATSDTLQGTRRQRRRRQRRRVKRTPWMADEATLLRRRAEAEGGKVLREIPQYVLDHAPLVHLYSGENFWPADIAEFVKHMMPVVNGSVYNKTAAPARDSGGQDRVGGDGRSIGGSGGDGTLTLNDLTYLNDVPGLLCLQSKEDVETRPEWLHSHVGIPTPFEDGDGEDVDDDIDGDEDSRGGRWDDSDDTTWYDVDLDHPLRRISDPRRVSGGPLEPPRQDRYGHEEPQPPRHPGGTGVGERPREPPGHVKHVKQQQQRRRQRGSKRPFWLGGGPMVRPQKQRDSDSDPAQKTLLDGHPPEQPSGRSAAPAVLVVVEKGSSVVDAFWFFFYAYNLGQTVLGMRFGNHVGDWEHCMVRFESGVPRAVFFSEHAAGQAYAWAAVEKRTFNSSAPLGEDAINGTYVPRRVQRPVIYSAVGSHAMYPQPGRHPYVLPFGMLADVTDRGPIWDPAKNIYAYFYDYTQGYLNSSLGLEPAASNPDAPTDWFHFDGPWGDELYPLADRRQWRLFGQYHYITGPQGPKFKALDRRQVCQTTRCRILKRIVKGTTWAD